MALYRVGGTTTVVAAGAVLLSLRAAAAGSRLQVREIGLYATMATAGNLQLIRATAPGTGSASFPGQATEPGDVAATGLGETAWSVQPTLATVPLMRLTLAGIMGGAVIYQFGPRELVVPQNASLVIVNRGAAVCSTYDFHLAWEE